MELGESFTDYSSGPTESTVGDDPSGAGDTGVGYGSSDSFGLSDDAIASIGQNQDQNFFGGSDYNVMDFGRGPVSNITDASNYDPNFAALGMIGRGLTPNSVLRNQINFDVPASMLPQIEGRLGPIGPKFYSPVEKALVEMEPVGIMAMAGKAFQSIKDSFTDAKNTLGKMGDAVGGLSLSDLTGVFSSNTGQKTVNDMADNVSFDASGNRIELASFPQKGADFLPTAPTNPIFSTPQVNTQQLDSMNRGGTGFATAAGSLFPRTVENSPNFSVPGEEELGMTIDRTGPNTYNLNSRDADFAREMNQLTPSERSFLTGRTNTINRPDDFEQLADASQFLNPQGIAQGLNYLAGPQIQNFFKGLTKNPNTTIRLGPGFNMEKQEADDNIFSINIPFATG